MRGPSRLFFLRVVTRARLAVQSPVARQLASFPNFNVVVERTSEHVVEASMYSLPSMLGQGVAFVVRPGCGEGEGACL